MKMQIRINTFMLRIFYGDNIKGKDSFPEWDALKDVREKNIVSKWRMSKEVKSL
jgi:hypothetical protein